MQRMKNTKKAYTAAKKYKLPQENSTWSLYNTYLLNASLWHKNAKKMRRSTKYPLMMVGPNDLKELWLIKTTFKGYRIYFIMQETSKRHWL
jgi:hypothetical protein